MVGKSELYRWEVCYSMVSSQPREPVTQSQSPRAIRSGLTRATRTFLALGWHASRESVHLTLLYPLTPALLPAPSPSQGREAKAGEDKDADNQPGLTLSWGCTAFSKATHTFVVAARSTRKMPGMKSLPELQTTAQTENITQGDSNGET